MRRLTPLLALCLFFPAALLPLAADEYKLDAVKGPPKGLSEKITETLKADGFRVSGPDGPLCEFWFVKAIDVKPGFKPTQSAHYPLVSGQLIGALRVPESTEFTDLREQKFEPGVFTLRYELQPEDGNHIGTSDVSDFLLALPAEEDTDVEPITDAEELSERSGESVDSSHPAIFLLLPPGKPSEKPTLTHDEDRDFQIVSFVADGKEKGKAVKMPIRLVVYGLAEE